MNRAAVVLVWLFMAIAAYGQHAIRGVVTDEHMQALPGANLVLEELKTGTVTHRDGSFTLLRIPEGSYTLQVTFVGFETLRESLTVSGDLDLGE